MLGKFYSSLRSKFSKTPAGLPDYFSRFGGLWTDRKDAEALLKDKAKKEPATEHMQHEIEFFIKNGFVILENAVSVEKIDAYLDALRHAAGGGSPLLASVPVYGPQDKAVIPLQQADLTAPLTKVLDTYMHLQAARELIFSSKIVNFLQSVFEERPLAFQGLHFEKGSTQAIHQDTAYVVLEDPMKLCASWIALEDVAAGSGELIYYPGSHRLPDWLYSGKFKHFNHERDQHEEHLAHLDSLHQRSAERGLNLQSFLPRKGDVLIWSADLAHGGSQISDPSLTRRSLVTHYTAETTKPYYFRFLSAEKQRTYTHENNFRYCTMYY